MRQRYNWWILWGRNPLRVRYIDGFRLKVNYRRPVRGLLNFSEQLLTAADDRTPQLFLGDTCY